MLWVQDPLLQEILGSSYLFLIWESSLKCIYQQVKRMASVYARDLQPELVKQRLSLLFLWETRDLTKEGLLNMMLLD